MEYFEEKLPNCIACGSNKISHFDERPSRGIYFEVTNFQLSKCADCGLIFINPRPTKELLETIYSKSGHSLKKPVSLEKVLESEKEYPNSSKDAKRVMDNAKKLLAGNGITDNVRVLDIGSGFGFYSKAALTEGYNVTAINPSVWENNVFEEINGFRPIQSFFEDCEFEEKFDLIILNHVLEHISDLESFLAKIREYLKDNGIFIVAVPNLNSYLVKMGSDGGVFWIPEHLNCFTKKSLKILFSRQKFDVIKIKGVSSYPYFAISNKLCLSGIKRKLCNCFVKYLQFLPLRFFNMIGWSGCLNVYLMKSK